MKPRLAILALAALPLLAACGGGATSLDPVAQAASSSSAQQSFRFTFHIAAGTQPGTADGEGAYDAKGKLARISIAIPAGAGSTQTTKLDLVTDASSGLVMYVRFPFLAAFLPQGKSWLRVDLSKQAAAKGVDLESLLQQNQSNPSELLLTLVHSKDAKNLGHDSVGGTDTTHYRTFVDPKDALLGGTTGVARDRLQKALDAAKVGPVPVDVWVGSDGLVRRLRMSVPQLTGQPGETTFTEELSGYGEDVAVSVPDPATVVDSTGKLGLPVH